MAEAEGLEIAVGSTPPGGGGWGRGCVCEYVSVWSRSDLFPISLSSAPLHPPLPCAPKALDIPSQHLSLRPGIARLSPCPSPDCGLLTAGLLILVPTVCPGPQRGGGTHSRCSMEVNKPSSLSVPRLQEPGPCLESGSFPLPRGPSPPSEGFPGFGLPGSFAPALSPARLRILPRGHFLKHLSPPCPCPLSLPLRCPLCWRMDPRQEGSSRPPCLPRGEGAARWSAGGSSG